MAMVSLLDLLRRIDSGKLKPGEAVQSALNEVGEQDDLIKAFVSVDREARAQASGPLSGITFGIKDIFDTADLPTQMGSAIYAGWRPKADAFVVTALKTAGATLLGKTSTTAFAHLDPTPTRNPRNPDHTPGGSSSGSAAAVAAGMVPLAIGTQSSGSTIRPASFCGVAALKPTFELIPTVGLKCSSWSLDTVGLFAATVEDLAFALAAITSRPEFRLDKSVPTPPRVGILLQEFAGAPELDSIRALELGVKRIEKLGATVKAVASPSGLEASSEAQATIQNYELWRSLAWEYRNHRDGLSEAIREHVERGEKITTAEYQSALNDSRVAQAALAEVFDDCDILLTYSAPGAAPKTLEKTGDPRYNKAWTVVGHPCLNVPGLANDQGMPVGLQVVGAFAQDARTLAAARFVESALV
jgi:Asp-tRNA(Asn)/Glu-tRNA(Gln) amidotransferase A subunit family amidase